MGRGGLGALPLPFLSCEGFGEQEKGSAAGFIFTCPCLEKKPWLGCTQRCLQSRSLSGHTELLPFLPAFKEVLRQKSPPIPPQKERSREIKVQHLLFPPVHENNPPVLEGGDGCDGGRNCLAELPPALIGVQMVMKR